MIFSNGGCLARYGCVTFWTTPCCRNALKSTTVTTSDIKDNKTSTKKGIQGIRMKSWKGSLCSVSGPNFSPQVRFNKDYPRFHRDVEFPSFKPYRKEAFKDVRKTKWGMGDEKPGYTYVVGIFGLVAGSYGVKSVLTHFVSSMSAAADVLAMATIEVDLNKVGPGACVSYKWRGKPLFIKNRTQADIDAEANTPLSVLRDPQTVETRTQKPEWLIVIGICTHLGCVPIANTGDFPGGFYCPCHGSHYDNLGRARKGPAPLNLEVPPYSFTSDTMILVG